MGRDRGPMRRRPRPSVQWQAERRHSCSDEDARRGGVWGETPGRWSFFKSRFLQFCFTILKEGLLNHA